VVRNMYYVCVMYDLSMSVLYGERIPWRTGHGHGVHGVSTFYIFTLDYIPRRRWELIECSLLFVYIRILCSSE